MGLREDDLDRLGMFSFGARSVARPVVDAGIRRRGRKRGRAEGFLLLGMRFVQAEQRVRPDQEVAHTGFMLGAAGIGTLCVRLALVARDGRWLLDFPDTPFVPP